MTKKQKKNKNKGPKLDKAYEVDDKQMENLATRITLTKTVKFLIPSAAFVISQQVFLYLEILNESARDHWILFALMTPISLLFLIYSYALVMNANAARLLKVRDIDCAWHIKDLELESKKKAKHKS